MAKVAESFDSFNADNGDAIASGAAQGKGTIPPPAAHWAYATLGSALALFMYPPSITGVLSTAAAR